MTKREFNEAFYKKHLNNKSFIRTMKDGNRRTYSTVYPSKDFKSLEVRYMYYPNPSTWNPAPRPYFRWARIYVANIVRDIDKGLITLQKIKKKLHNIK